MSTTIDQRVVEMRFDNKNFESNVSTTMSSLEKLKQRLNLTGASKGLDEINSSAKKVNLSGIGTAVETVQAKFSALDVVAMTTLANITNQAVNTGKRMISALTIDPIKTGFQEYETQINATQTILANTASKGSTIDDVNKALKELNDYADLTIYNFTEMTRNIGTFTAAGIDLDTSVNAIQGIANLAAVSGSTSQQASTAMYQLSQALAAGTVKLMDWNSVVNAGMGGEMFQNALKKTSEELGTGAEAAIKASGSFRESLRDGWLTSEVLTETLKKFTTSGAKEYVAEYIGESPEVVQAALDEAEAMYGEAEAIEYASKALAEKSGKNKEEIKQALEFAKNAEDAATKVKTFTQLWDVLKEAAQSGWSQSWKLIIGDFEQAKNLLTPLSDFLTGVINGMSEARNKLLESALGKSFTGLLDNVKKSADGVKAVVDSVKDYASVVDEIIGGKWGNGQERWDKLAKAGYDWAHAQNMVNEKLGNAKRHATDYKEAQDGVAESQEKVTESTEEMSEATIAHIVSMTKLSDAQLKARGYEDDQIKAFRELADAAEKTGIPLDEFIRNIDEIDGRYLLFNSFKNVGQSLVKIFQAMGQAWKEVFPPMTGDQLFNIIAGMHKLSTYLVMSDETADKLKRTFKGVFAIIGLVTDILGGGLKIAFKLVGEVLKYFDLGILDVTAAVGDAIVNFREWLHGLFDISSILDVLVPLVTSGVGAVKKFAAGVKKWFDAFIALPEIQAALKRFNTAFDKLVNGIGPSFNKKIQAIIDWFAAFKEIPQVQGAIEKFSDALATLKAIDISGSIRSMINSFLDLPLVQKILTHFGATFDELGNIDLTGVGKNIVDGLTNGIKDAVKNAVVAIIDLGTAIIEGICDILDINSPSKVFIAIGGFIIAGLLLGLKEGFISVPESLQGIVDKCLTVIQNIDWGAIFAAGVTVAGLMFIKKIGDALESFAAPFEGLGDIFEEASKVVKSFGKVTKAIALEIKTKALKNLAVSLLILVGAIAILTFLDPKEMWNAVLVIAALAGVLAVLAWATGKMSDASVSIGKNGASISGLKQNLLTIGIAMLTLAAIVKIVGSMGEDDAKRGFSYLTGMMIAMLGFLTITRKVVSNKAAKDIANVGKLMTKISIALLLMVAVVKLAGSLDAEEINRGTRFMIGFTALIAGFTLIAKSGAKQHIDKVGGMAIKLAIAMGLMVVVCKLVDLLEPMEMLKGAGFAAAFLLFVKGLVWATKIDKGNEIAKLGGLLLSISFSMMLMVGLCKLVGKLSTEDMIKGAIFAAAFLLFIKGLVSATTIIIGEKEKVVKLAGTILAISIAMGVLAAVSMMLSLMSIGGLIKGVTAVSILAGMMALLIHVTKDANDVAKTVNKMAIAIGIMAISVVALSFIKPSKLAGAVAAMGVLMGMFALIIKSTQNVKGSLPTLIVMTVAVGLFAAILWALSKLEVKASLTNAAALSLLLLAVSGCMLILSKANLSIKNALVGVLALTAMAVPLLAFVGVLALMQNVQKATANTDALVKLASVLTLLLIPLTIIGTFAISALVGVGLLTLMAIPLLAFVGVLALMQGIENATTNTKLLIDLMTTMSDVLIKVSLIAPLALLGVKGMLALTGLMIVVGGLAIAVGALMDKFPSLQKFLDTGLPVLEQLAGSIGTMIGKFIGGIGEGISDSLVKMGEDIAAFMDALSKASENASGVDGEAFAGVKSLMDVMADIAKTTVGTTLGDIFTLGGTSMEKFQTDGEAFFEAMKAIGEASQGINIDRGNVDAVIEVALSLSKLQSSLEPIGGVITWFTGRDDLGTFGINAAVFIGSMKLAFDAIDGATFNVEAMDAIITAATSLADLQSKLEPIGGMIEWFTGRDDLGSFGVSIGEFIFSIGLAFAAIDGKTFNTEGMDAIISAATSLANLQSSLEPIGGVISWFTGRDDLGTFGINVGLFIGSMKTAFATLDGVELNTEAMKTIIGASRSLATLQSSLEPIGGVITWFTGRDDLGAFGKNIGKFITSMKEALATLEGATLTQESLDSVINAATSLAKLQSQLEPVGGVISWFTGRDDLGTFGTNIGLFATAMGTLKTEMGENGITEDVITSVTNAGNAIIELQKALPTEGWFDGKMDLSEFSEYVTDFSTAMNDFATKAAEIDSTAVNTAINTAYRIKNLIGSLVDLDTSGVAVFTGVGIGGPGADGAASAVAKAISSFNDEVSDIDTSAVSTSVSAALKLKSLISGLVDLDASGVETFKKVKSIGSTMKTYGDNVGDIDSSSVSSSITSVKRLVSLIESMADLDSSGVSTFSSAVAELSKVNMSALADSVGDVSKFTTIGKSIVDAITKGISTKQASMTTAGTNLIVKLSTGIKNKQAVITTSINAILNNMRKAISMKESAFRSAGESIMSKFASGIKTQSNEVKKAVTGPLADGVSAARNYYGSFYSAGSYLVSGFASGISDNISSAATAAAAMANAAEKAAKKALDINSPSKVFRRIGYSVPEGFAQGIDRTVNVVKASAVDMTDTAVDSVSKAISRISDAVHSDMDAQPTIRPVLDLSEVQSGAATISGLFNNPASIGVMANVGAISSSMNRRQNGSNDVVSAIDKLRKDVSNMGNTYYTLEGVNYTEGSDVANALEVITRTAIRERRV